MEWVGGRIDVKTVRKHEGGKAESESIEGEGRGKIVCCSLLTKRFTRRPPCDVNLIGNFGGVQ